MTQPWIIWTTLRTGGTTLYEALQTASPDLRYVENEPFTGVWSPKAWPPGSAERSIRNRLGSYGYAVKHALDPFPDEFNAALARTSTSLGYAHVHLVRRDRLAWLLSREVAVQLGAWHPNHSLPLIDDLLAGRRKLAPLDVAATIEYSRKVPRQWAAVKPHLGDVLEVAYEDLYGDNRPHAAAALAAFLGIRVDFSRKLSAGGQDTSRVWHLIPNLDELRAALASS